MKLLLIVLMCLVLVIPAFSAPECVCVTPAHAQVVIDGDFSEWGDDVCAFVWGKESYPGGIIYFREHSGSLYCYVQMTKLLQSVRIDTDGVKMLKLDVSGSDCTGVEFGTPVSTGVYDVSITVKCWDDGHLFTYHGDVTLCWEPPLAVNVVSSAVFQIGHKQYQLSWQVSEVPALQEIYRDFELIDTVPPVPGQYFYNYLAEGDGNWWLIIYDHTGHAIEEYCFNCATKVDTAVQFIPDVYDLTVYNVLGQVVYSEREYVGERMFLPRGLANGIYFIRGENLRGETFFWKSVKISK